MFLGNQSALTEAKLAEAKPLIRLFGLDYDGTVSDGVNYKQSQVFALVEKILGKNKSVAIVTASAATALRKLVDPMRESLLRSNFSAPCFLAIGNGTILYEVKKDGLVEIYNQGFDLPQITRVVEAGRKAYEKLKISNADLVEKGLETFKKFLQESWEGDIPAEMIAVCRPFDGELFAEKGKVTFVLPKDKTSHAKVVAELSRELGEGYQVAAGDEIYVHITKYLGEDGKAVAIKNILKTLGLEPTQVVTFGDMPVGNDAGLLSFPYSFTNSDEFLKIKEKMEQPPFVLTNPDLSPVARVYKAIEDLIS